MRIRQVVVERIAVVQFGMNNGGCSRETNIQQVCIQPHYNKIKQQNKDITQLSTFDFYEFKQQDKCSKLY